jgi:hypothetical protein
MQGAKTIRIRASNQKEIEQAGRVSISAIDQQISIKV